MYHYRTSRKASGFLPYVHSHRIELVSITQNTWLALYTVQVCAQIVRTQSQPLPDAMLYISVNSAFSFKFRISKQVIKTEHQVWFRRLWQLNKANVVFHIHPLPDTYTPFTPHGSAAWTRGIAIILARQVWDSFLKSLFFNNRHTCI